MVDCLIESIAYLQTNILFGLSEAKQIRGLVTVQRFAIKMIVNDKFKYTSYVHVGHKSFMIDLEPKVMQQPKKGLMMDKIGK